MSVLIDITAAWESAAGVPLTSPGTVPTIRIRRLDTQALVVTDDAMTEVGDGLFSYTFDPPVKGIKYSVRADGDPAAGSQVPAVIRFMYGLLSNRSDENWTLLGQDPNDPVTITDNNITSPSGNIDQTLTGDGEVTKTITRDT